MKSILMETVLVGGAIVFWSVALPVAFVWPAVAVEEVDRVVSSVAGEMAVVAVDHGQAGAHVAGELECGDSGTEGEGRESMAEIVDPPEGLDADDLLRGLPVAVAEVV